MKKIRIGIDIGSSKTTIIVGELYDSGKSIKVLGHAIIPSNGVKKGKIIDGDLFTRTLKLGKEKLEEKIGIKIKKATIGLSGNDIKSSTTEVEYELTDDDDLEGVVVTEEHCEKILEISKKKVVKDEEQVLTKEIYNYRLDESGIMKNIIGKKGRKLEARVHLVKIPKLRVKQVVEVLNKVGIEVDSLLYNGEAGAKSALKKVDRTNGVALVDIGGGLTEITIFKNNKLISTNIIPLGGVYYINDLKYILELNEETVKNILSEMEGKSIDEKIVITYTENGKSLTKTFDMKYLRDIIDARTDEILEYICKSIEASGYKEYLKNGIVLSGGVVESYDIQERLKKIVKYDVRVSSPISIEGLNVNLKVPSSVTGVGILLTILEDEYTKLQNGEIADDVEEEKDGDNFVEEEKVEEKELIDKSKDVENERKEGKKEKRSRFQKVKKWINNFI